MFKIIFAKITSIFKQGISAKAMALSISVALALGVVPVLGISTILITCTALWLRLNLPIMIFIGYVAAPLQLTLLMLFIHVGEIVFKANHTLLTIADIKSAFAQSFFQALQSMSFEILCGLVGWLLFILPFIGISYFLFFLILNKILLPKANTLNGNS